MYMVTAAILQKSSAVTSVKVQVQLAVYTSDKSMNCTSFHCTHKTLVHCEHSQQYEPHWILVAVYLTSCNLIFSNKLKYVDSCTEKDI